jgi:hypothetical protein
MSFRSREQSVIIFIIGMLSAGYWLVLATRAITWHHSISETIFLVFVAAAFAAVIFRAAYTCARVEGRRLMIVNIFRTTRVDIDEIVEFRLGPKRSSIFYGAGAVELRDGREIVIFGIQAPNPDFRPHDSSAQKLVNKLNAWLEETRAQIEAENRAQSDSPPTDDSTEAQVGSGPLSITP